MNGIRVTVCDNCAQNYGLTNDPSVIKKDYEKVKKSNDKIDTREKDI